MKKILVTGSAGFIGYYLVKRLLENPDNVVIGLGNMNDYYDVSLKEARLRDTNTSNRQYNFIRGDLADKPLIDKLLMSINLILLLI